MPIQVKDFTWEETEKILCITVPLKGVKSNKVDIFTTEEYIKVHYPPYLFESFLFSRVCDEESSAAIGNGMVIFKLEKQVPAIWGQLQKTEVDERKMQVLYRESAHQRSQERSAKKKQESDKKRQEQHRLGVKQQLAVEDQERLRIEAMKENERQQATRDLEAWKEQQRVMAQEGSVKNHETVHAVASDISASENTRNAHNTKTEDKGKEPDIFAVSKTPLRQSGKIQVKFTERTFPTPSRESTAPDEQEWLRKQADAQRVAQIEDADLTDEEKNPLWLRDKGNSFFASGQYQAAISAYSQAIRLGSKMPVLFSNRAACHLKLRNFFKCIEDCSVALANLTPPVQQNLSSRVKAHVRRGTAFCQLELYAEGLQDYEAALKLEPQNEQLKKDAEKIRDIIQGSTVEMF